MTIRVEGPIRVMPVLELDVAPAAVAPAAPGLWALGVLEAAGLLPGVLPGFEEALARATVDGTGPVSSLPGGCILEGAPNLQVLPQCCGEIGDLRGWIEAVRHADATWREVWIGHPCLVARRTGSRIELSEGVEPGGSPVAPAEGQPVYSIDRDALAEALAGAAARVALVRGRVAASLVARGAPLAVGDLLGSLLGRPETAE